MPHHAYGGIAPDGVVEWESFDEHYRTGTQDLTNFACRNFSDPGFDVRTVSDRGDPGYAITVQAEKIGADLIMMPTHGRGAFRSFLVGSATIRVLHRAHCAVWTGTHLEDGGPPSHVGIGKILCALDVDRESAHVVECAAAMAEKFSAEVCLVHCVPATETGPAEEFLSELDRFLAETAAERIADVQEQAGTNFEVCLEGGTISKVVREAAIRQGSDLVVIGRGHSHGPLSRLRTNAYAIVRDAPCPVLSI
jgi:nucleotide-binding universal stress UspA family protein